MTHRPDRRGIRAEPPPFRRTAVGQVTKLTPYMARVTFVGPELAGLQVEQPAASVRLLLPSPGTDRLPDVHWDGNRYRLADGGSPIIRTFTPLNYDPAGALDLEIVLHDEGAATRWLERCAPGEPAAISDPGRGHTIDNQAGSYVLLGDESALPAVKQLIGGLDATMEVQVAVEVRSAAAELDMPLHPRLEVTWAPRQPGEAIGEPLLRAIDGLAFGAGTRVWAAGEAGAMHGVRRRLFDEIGVDRSAATVRGYWKHGR